MNEEARQLSMQDSKASTSTAFLAETKTRRDRKDITCFNCGEKGHYRNECPKTKKGETKKEETVTAAATMDTEKAEDFSW